MNIKARRLIYLIFIVIFLIVAPVIIMYTAGYRYNFQKGKVEQVGVLFINVLPKDAQILINNGLQTNTRPLRLSDLRPNYYDVKIIKDGYYDWEKNLEVKNKASTLAYDVVLFKKSSPTKMADGGTQTAMISPTGDLLAFVNTEGVWKKDISKDVPQLIWPKQNLDAEKITWSENEKKIILKTKENNFYIIETSGNTEPLYLNGLIVSIQKTFFDSTGNNIFVLSDNELYKVELDNKQSEKILSGIKDFQMIKRDIYIIKNDPQNSLVYKYNSLGFFNNTTLLGKLPLGHYQLQELKNNFLTVQGQNQIYLIDISSGQQPILTLSGDKSTWGEGEKNTFLYYLDKQELWIFDPIIRKNYMLNRFDKDIENVFPVYNAPYFILKVNQNIYLSELDDRDKRQNNTLFQGRDIKNLQIDRDGKNIYFLDRLKNGYELFKLEIQ